MKFNSNNNNNTLTAILSESYIICASVPVNFVPVFLVVVHLLLLESLESAHSPLVVLLFRGQSFFPLAELPLPQSKPAACTSGV